MKEDSNMHSNQSFNIDPEQLKIIVNVIKKCVIDLSGAKQKADAAWNDCRTSLGENVTKDIDERKHANDKKFKKAISEVENSTNVLSTVANIWKDTENEIMSSSKDFEEIVNKINNNLVQAFGFKLFKTEDKQNDSSNI